MGVLDGLKPERVFYYFEEMSKIPHGSYNCKAISDYCLNVGKSFDLEAYQDESLNVIIKKPASPGYGDAKTLMIQAHMDMVCVKDNDVEFDFMNDALRLSIKDGYINASGTTLGADDGIGVALALAVLEDDTIEHPDLEVVFTTEEEVGMEGAIALDLTDFKSSYLLNLDSEDETILLAGCAGGCSAKALISMETASVSGTAINITINGLVGGHSGAEIDKNQANANILLGRLLFMLHEKQAFGIVSVAGGEKENAIPTSSSAVIIADEDDVNDILTDIEAFAAVIAGEYPTSDPNISINAVPGLAGSYEVFSLSMMERLIFILTQLPNGIQTMCADLPQLVESSLNLGVMSTDDDGVELCWSIRSSVKSRMKYMKDKLKYLIEFMGAEIIYSNDYPEWPFNPKSKLCALLKNISEEVTGKVAVITTIHAGLECGILSEKLPNLDMVSFGPSMKDIHTSRERLEIASVERTYAIILKFLKEFKNYCV